MIGSSDDNSSFFSRLAQRLGLQRSAAKEMDRMARSLQAARTANVDRLEAHTDRIGMLERRLLQKKKELDASRGGVARVLIAEIEQTFHQLESMGGVEAILRGNLGRISTALAKIEEWRAAQLSGAGADALAEIALGLEDTLERLKAADREVGRLAAVRYDPPVRSEDSPARRGGGAGEDYDGTMLSEALLMRLQELEKRG